VPNLMENDIWAMPLIILFSLGLSLVGVVLFRKRQWF
jgi:magnesium transporter